VVEVPGEVTDGVEADLGGEQKPLHRVQA
jgi:hypothetical protein